MIALPDLSIIIPAYNEEARIRSTLIQIDDFLAQSSDLAPSYEIVVIDDGSSDGTVALVDRISLRRPRVRCVQSKPNRGKGAAVRLGMIVARGRIRLMCDADGSIPAEEIPKVVVPILRGEADIAIGSRYLPGAAVTKPQPRYRVVWSRLANWVVQRAVCPGIRDTQCGFKAFTAAAAIAVFHQTRIDGWAFDLEALALAQRIGFAIRETAVAWADDPRSKINPLADMWRVIGELLAIRRNLRHGVYALPSRT